MSGPDRPLAVITGASSGLGAAFARAYAARGCDLLITARRLARLEALAAELTTAHGVRVTCAAADLSAPDGEAPVLAALGGLGRSADILVNNAGFSIPQSFAAAPWSRQREFLFTLVVAPCALAHALLPAMVARGSGRILNVSSLAAFAPGAAGHSLYPGAKSLMLSFSEALDAEYRDRGVKVTALCPGFVRTEFAEANATAHLMSGVPRQAWQTAEAVVAAAIAGNEAGRVVVIPGWRNRLAAALLSRLPRRLVRAVVRAGSARYHLGD